MNGYVIEHSHKSQDIAEVEAKIGDLCSRQTQPVPIHLSCGGFRTSYEPHARVHMLWYVHHACAYTYVLIVQFSCRLRLRAPGLSNKATWLPSLSICLHAAGGVLSTYLLLYQPVLVTLARQSNKDTHSTDKTLTPIAHKLAATWRQVRRIMMSVFVIAFAYWHGELIHTEAARYMAIARLLLEYPRWKWGEKLNEAIQTLIDISHFSDFILEDHMRALLPEVNERFPRPLHHDHAAPDAVTAYDHAVDQTASYDEAAMRLWPETFEGFGVDGHDISAFEQQTLFGAWDIEFALDGGA
nr:hypothetical protein CFP56_22183 [Quercus suber]